MNPNSIIRTGATIKWRAPGPEKHPLAILDQFGAKPSVTLFAPGADADGVPGIPVGTGYGATVRDAYREADHQRRYSRYTIEGLLRERRQSTLDYEVKLMLASASLDHACANYEAELSALRNERDALQAELTAVRVDKMKAERALQATDDRIRALEMNGHEKDKGMALVRTAFEEVGITGGNLVERVHALAAERDQFKAAARQNTAATAAS